jgi:hypothetical protein
MTLFKHKGPLHLQDSHSKSVSWTPRIESTFSHHFCKIHITLSSSVPTSLLPSHDHTNNSEWSLEFMKLLILQFPPASCCLLPFSSVVLNWEYPMPHKAVCEMIFYTLSNTNYTLRGLKNVFTASMHGIKFVQGEKCLYHVFITHVCLYFEAKVTPLKMVHRVWNVFHEFHLRCEYT